ncbi:outer membrane lipid asymmetry maintenance protein MlaD [Candidatus Odyssella acanthamoebae]|uniref:ATPase AAA n=1 Tax=Candidatus Odyssella acanthamoebae TaxID=91604 RepID=A0A077AZG9_9PROT|nr:outer membrane lipid asymmetry maintenance protein MlaD [Candidatus Paracaedibacter acanthamoebae]AIK96140.1 ATPase AAA [Candidatus Paracaedibacter acanthamoebae]
MRANVVEAITGAVVLAIASGFFYYAYTASGTKVVNGYNLYAKFDRIDGLVEGNDIKLSGVKIGDIQHISIDPKTFLARVDMNVDSSIILPEDTSAQIVSESLMGGKYIALVPGGSDVNLAPGDQVTYTQSSISLEGLIGKYLFANNEEGDNKADK